MNPFRENDAPHVDKTEVEIARIRETEETKRHRTAEQEKTKQVARSNDGFWWTRVVAACALILVSLIGYAAYTAHLRAVYPNSAIASCVETAEIVTAGNNQRECANGGWFEALPTSESGETLIRCHCTPKPSASTVP